MSKIQRYNRITKEVFNIASPSGEPLLVIKHVMILKRGHKTIDINQNKEIYNGYNHFYEYETKNEYNNLNYTNLGNIIFYKTTEWLVLENRQEKIQNPDYEDYMKCRLFYKDFYEIKKQMNLLDHLFQTTTDLYTVDAEGNVIDIKSIYAANIYLTHFKGYGNRFLSFQPSVLYDKMKTYPSVEIKCDQGLLCNITYDEFCSLKMFLIEYFNNFTLLSSNLLILAYSHLNNKNNIGENNNENIIDV